MMKTYKNVTYFKTHKIALEHVKDKLPFASHFLESNGGLIVRIFKRGYAIQMCNSGPYYNDELNGFV